MLGKLSVWGGLLIWITVGQGPIALTVCRVGIVWTFFVYLISFRSPSLGDDPIPTDILSQRTVIYKTTNPPIVFEVPIYVVSCIYIIRIEYYF